jgi:hypothetical protein
MAVTLRDVHLVSDLLIETSDWPTKRRRLHESIAKDPPSNPAVIALLGAWVHPEEAYSNDAWNVLVAV